MKTQCPNCQTRFKAPDSYAGKKAKCLKCNNSFIVELLKSEPEKVPASNPPPVLPIPPIKQKDNFPARLWNGSPVYFRNSFWATLGVLSALVFAYNFMSIPKFINKSTIVPEQKTGIMPSSTSNSNLAGCIVLLNYIYKFEAMSNARATAADKFLQNEFDTHTFLFVIKTTESQLENLYLRVHKLKMADDENLQSCYHSLLDAIDAEYTFQKSILSLLQNPDELRAKADFQELNKKTVVSGTLATASVLSLLSKTDENLYEKIVYIYNIESN